MPIQTRLAASVAFAAWCAMTGAVAAQAADETAAERVCPMDIPDTSVFTLELESGETGLAFVTTERVDELRGRVLALAALQNSSDVENRAVASVELIDQGAILAFRPGPAPAGGNDELQSDVLSYAQRLVGGDCPMTSDQSSVVPARKPRAVPGQGPLPTATVPGVNVADANISTFITSIPGAIGF